MPVSETSCHDCKAYVDRLLAEHVRWVEAKFEAAQLATDKFEGMLGARLSTMNEMRSQLDRQASLFVTRKEMDDALAVAFNKLLAIVSLLITVAAFVLGYITKAKP